MVKFLMVNRKRYNVFHNQLKHFQFYKLKSRYFKGFLNLLGIYFMLTKMRCF